MNIFFIEQMSQLSDIELRDEAMKLVNDIANIEKQLTDYYDMYSDHDIPYERRGWCRSAKNSKRHKQAELNCIQGMLSNREAC